MIMQIASDVAGRYASHGYFVVLDGVVRPDWLPVFVALGAPLHYIVLRTTQSEAVERCAARGGDSLSDREVVAQLYAQFADLGAHEAHVLAVAGKSRQQTLQAVIAALESNAFRITVP